MHTLFSVFYSRVPHKTRLSAQSSLSIFAQKNLPKYEDTYFMHNTKISVFVFTKIVLEQRYLDMIAPFGGQFMFMF